MGVGRDGEKAGKSQVRAVVEKEGERPGGGFGEQERGQSEATGGREGGSAGVFAQVHRGSLLIPAPSLPQIKVEEDFGFEADEALDSSWVSRGPDKLLPYPTLASPPFD